MNDVNEANSPQEVDTTARGYIEYMLQSVAPDVRENLLATARELENSNNSQLFLACKLYEMMIQVDGICAKLVQMDRLVNKMATLLAHGIHQTTPKQGNPESVVSTETGNA